MHAVYRYSTKFCHRQTSYSLINVCLYEYVFGVGTEQSLFRCFQCKVEEELVDCILLHCSKARVLWHLLFSLFGVPWVLLAIVRDTFLGWHGSFVDKGVKRFGELLLYTSIWRKERNCKLFENEEQYAHVLKGVFL